MRAVGLLAALVGVPAAATLAPVDGAIYRLTREQVRDDGSGPLRFVIVQDVTFRRTPVGIVAELGPPAPDDAAPDRRQSLLTRAYRTLATVPVRVVFDSSGALRAIEDEPAVWRRFLDAMEEIARGSDDPAAVRGLVAGLHAMPATERRAFLAAPILPLIAGTLPADGRRAVEVDSGAPGTTIAGAETLTTLGARRHRRTTATGTVPAAGPLPARTVTIDREEAIDPATGLILERREDSTTRMTLGGRERVLRNRSISLLVSRYPSANPREP